MPTEPFPGLLHRIGVTLGLLHPPEGMPSKGGKGRRSRYGIRVSARMDDDIDELRARIAKLEDCADG